MKERVGLIGENSIEYVRTLIRIWNDGDCAVLIDWRIPFLIATEMMEDAGVMRCIIDENILIKNGNMKSAIEFVPIKKKDNYAECVPRDIQDEFSESYSNDEAIILYSSGTTGKAKGIILSHFAINTNADAIIDYMDINGDDCIYIVKTFAHSSTLVGELLVGLKRGAKIVVSPTIVTPRYSMENIVKYQATVLCVNPTLLNLYVSSERVKRHNFDCLKVIYTSGAIADALLMERAKEVFNGTKVLNVYGLSEAGPRVTAQTIKDEVVLSGSVGRAIRGVKIKVIEEDGTVADNNTKGIVHVSTPSLFKGYVSSQQCKVSLYEDWFNTGDVGYIDDTGNLFITGRADNMINIGSHNVYPEEVENVIMKYNGISDCVVLSVRDKIHGKKMICHYLADTELSSQLREFCMKNLSSYEIPQEFIKSDKLKTTPNGKKIRKL